MLDEWEISPNIALMDQDYTNLKSLTCNSGVKSTLKKGNLRDAQCFTIFILDEWLIFSDIARMAQD